MDIDIDQLGIVRNGQFHPCPNLPYPQSPAETSDNSASHSSGNGYKSINHPLLNLYEAFN